MSYFKNLYNPGGDQAGVFFALSTDGINWTEQNNGAPVIPGSPLDEKLVRDPFIYFDAPVSTFRLVYTTGWKTKNIGYMQFTMAEGKSFTNFQDWDMLNAQGDRQIATNVADSIPGALCAWGPEIFWDDLQDKYMIYWSSDTGTVDPHGFPASHQGYYMLTTDFKAYTKPVKFFDPGFTVIHGNLLKVADSLYYLFFKDNRDAQKKIYYVTGPTPQGPWGAISKTITTFPGTDGPSAIKMGNEYRIYPKTLVVTISQSGETADTLAALNHAKVTGHLFTLAICNVPESAIVRQSKLRLMTRAGPEIGVASTKAFTTQLAALFLLTLVLAKLRGRLSAEREQQFLHEMRHLPAAVQKVLALEPKIAELSKHFADKHHALFLGRGMHYPIALEGALKLKEISYIHAEAYPAGELKHGPLALVDKDMPVVSVAPNDALLEKLKSNLQEVRARGGELYVFADANTHIKEAEGIHILQMPEHAGFLSPILHTIPLQLLAYYVALQKGTDVDKPRNLAKSVTVE